MKNHFGQNDWRMMKLMFPNRSPVDVMKVGKSDRMKAWREAAVDNYGGESMNETFLARLHDAMMVIVSSAVEANPAAEVDVSTVTKARANATRKTKSRSTRSTRKNQQVRSVGSFSW